MIPMWNRWVICRDPHTYTNTTHTSVAPSRTMIVLAAGVLHSIPEPCALPRTFCQSGLIVLLTAHSFFIPTRALHIKVRVSLPVPGNLSNGAWQWVTVHKNNLEFFKVKRIQNGERELWAWCQKFNFCMWGNNLRIIKVSVINSAMIKKQYHPTSRGV